jgi:hypothetical protein
METIINQRECLRTHIASVKAYTAGLRELKLYDHNRGSFRDGDISLLDRRLDEIEGFLEHHQLTSETTVKSMENLLSLVSDFDLVFQERITNETLLGIQH